VIYGSVDELLEAARDGLTRLSPEQAAEAVAEGATLVDIRPEWQRREDGEIPGSLVIEYNHLLWRLHPTSDARVPQAGWDRRWVVVCTEGYTSSLAAASLRSLGLNATDLVGGLYAWRDAGLPVVAGPTPIEHVVADPQGAGAR
jgi:rhodanese-related sulfurtransferase